MQANHVAPQGAKYSQENVRKEKEQSRVSLFLIFTLKDLGRPRGNLLGPMGLLLISTKSLNGFEFLGITKSNRPTGPSKCSRSLDGSGQNRTSRITMMFYYDVYL